MSSNQDDSDNVLHYAEHESDDVLQQPPEPAVEAPDPYTFEEIAEGLPDGDAGSIPDHETENDVEQDQDDSYRSQNVTNESREEVDGTPSQESEQHEASLDDTASIPDDTPSIRGSRLSSPRSETPSSLRVSRRGSTSNMHRPFDRRFQSRLSSSYTIPGRTATPDFLKFHSRSSSFASFVSPSISETDESNAPWDVLRWNKLRKITGQAFSEIGKRNFGSPTSLAVADQIVIGTSKGIILVFDHQQNSKAMIGPGTKAIESGSVTSLAVSADHTTIAAAHSTGHIFTWEISKPSKPFLHIMPIEVSQAQARRSDGHVSGTAVVHVGFLGYRHTALVSADDRGMAFSHLATRGMGAVNRVVRTTRILGRYPEVLTRGAKPLKKSSVLAFSSLPLGNVEQRTDSLGLVAMLTPYLLVIVSTTPIAQTQHKAARPKDVTAHSAMTAALAWFPAIKLKGKDTETSNTKLVYAWSNVLTVLEVHEIPSEDEADKERPPELQFLPRNRYKAEEAIVAVQWLSRSVIAILTITQQLVILEDVSMNVTESFDLLQRNIYHADLYSQQLQAVIESLDEEDTSMHGVVADAFHMSFRSYKGRLFLLGFNDIWWGSLTNWADRLLALMNIGDFIGAVRLATRYYAGQGEKLTIGLPENDSARWALVEEKLLEMMSASLKYAFGKNKKAGNEPIEESQMRELAEACITACITTSNLDFMFDEVFDWYDEHEHGTTFVEILEPYILNHQVTRLPPPALKTLIEHFSTTHIPSTLEEIICLLDTSTMDIDQVTSLCKRYNLYDAYIYVWNSALTDFTTPLEEFLQLTTESQEMNGHIEAASKQRSNAEKIFPYLSFIWTGRTYPTGKVMEETLSGTAKSQIYTFFFSGRTTPKRSFPGEKRPHPYDNLYKILTFDTPSFISALNEAFEDSFLNTSDEDDNAGIMSHRNSMGQKSIYNRQYIVRIMLEVMSNGFDPEDTLYLDMFIARNLPKYPQYMLLSGTALQEVFDRLCKYPTSTMREDAQLSIEYLLSVYHPSNILALVPLLQDAGFYRVLKSVFRQERQYVELIQTFFVDDEDKEGIFPLLREVLRPGSDLSDRQRDKVLEVVQSRALDLTAIDVRAAAITMDNVAKDLHEIFLRAMEKNTHDLYEYLNALFEAQAPQQRQQQQQYSHSMLELYIRLMCQYDPSHVRDFVETIKEGDLRLQEVLPALETSNIIDAVVILQARQGQVKMAMSRLSQHLSSLKAALRGLRPHSPERADMRPSNEAIQDVLQSIEKYARVGIWLCQNQSKSSQKSKSIAKSPRRNALAQPLTVEESLWLELIITVVAIAREGSDDLVKNESDTDNGVVVSLRTVIQQVFTALLTVTSSNRDSAAGTNDLTFLRILRAFLSHAAEVSPSLSELRNVITSIFSAYAYEESLLVLANTMLDKDVFVHLDKVTLLRQQGWRPRGQICEVCRRRVWGPGTGDRIWDAWQQKEDARLARRLHVEDSDMFANENASRGKGKAAVQPPQPVREGQIAENSAESSQRYFGPIVVFSCRHLYHQRCLNSRNNRSDGEQGEQDPSAHDTAHLACPACA